MSLFWLWISYIALIIAGSLYPFHFEVDRLTYAQLADFSTTWGFATSRGDLLANLALFMPAGALGVLALHQHPPWQRVAITLVVCALVAVGCQVLQIIVPRRTPTLVDSTWNLVGVLPALVLGLLPWRRWLERHLQPSGEALQLMALLLLLGWLAERWFPYLPALDWQQIKHSLKPLLLYPQLSLNQLFIQTSSCLVLAYLLRQAAPNQRWDRWLPLLLLAVFGGEVLIIYNALQAMEVAGALLACLLWFGGIDRLRQRAAVVASLALGALLVQGLSPFQWREVAADWQWLPLRSLLQGNMAANAEAAVAKLFLYASTVYLWREATGRLFAAAALVAAVTALVEFVQRHIVNRTPETTDLLLVALAALFIATVERQAKTITAPRCFQEG